MALQSKTISSQTTSNGYTLVLELTEDSTSLTGNTSSVSWKLKLKSGANNSFSTYAIGWEIVLNGTQVSYQARDGAPRLSLTYNSSLTLASGTSKISHNSDGELSMSVKASIDMASVSYTPGPLSLSGTMNLTKINRGLIYIDNGSKLEAYQVFIDNGTSWDQYIPHIDNGSSWDQYG